MSAGNGFSATNAPRIGAKLAYVKLNIQTPSPPRGAVPVNLGRTWEALSFWSFRIEFGHGCDRPAMSRVLMPKRGPAVHLPSESDGSNRFSSINTIPNVNPQSIARQVPPAA